MDAQKIPVLLAEYNTLRAEVLAARVAVGQVIGIGVPAASGLIGLAFAAPDEWPKYPFFILVALIVLSVAGVGERLLLWETDHGWGSIIWPTNKHYKGHPKTIRIDGR